MFNDRRSLNEVSLKSGSFTFVSVVCIVGRGPTCISHLSNFFITISLLNHCNIIIPINNSRLRSNKCTGNKSLYTSFGIVSIYMLFYVI